MISVTPRRPRTPSLDNLCSSATELARAAARDVGGDEVGEHLGCQAEADRVVTHHFASLVPGYVGWRWAVTVVRAPRQRVGTVDEVILLPGPDALLAPEWVPWSERLRPGDLGVGDILPTPPDDERLVPGYVDSGDPAADEVGWELGLGRPREMSRSGRADTADRWYSGDSGPDTPMARSAPGRCGTCGFYLPLAGSLRAVFGACGNEYSPADGQVVSADHGCGAHSEALVESGFPEPLPAVVYDDMAVEELPAGDASAGDASAGDAPAGDAPAGDAPAGDAPAGDAPAGDTAAEPGPGAGSAPAAAAATATTAGPTGRARRRG